MSSYSRRSRCDYSRSPSPYYRRRKSVSPARSRGCSRSREIDDVDNPGNNLYVTGLSSRVTRRDLEKHFAAEGDVVDVHLVMDPWTGDSRGFGFVTMASLKDAERCLKYLDRSVLEGRVITVEKARRRRGRTPTPGRYLGARTAYDYRRSPSYSPYYRRYDDSDGYSSDRERSYSPYYRRRRYRSRSRSPYDRYNRSTYRRRHRRSYSPDYSRSYSPRDRSESPYYRRRDRSESPCYRRRGHYRSVSRSVSPRRRRTSRRSYSRSVSPGDRRMSRRSYSRSVSPRRDRSYSRSCSPPKKRSPSRSVASSVKRGRAYSRESYAHSRSRSRSSPSLSRSG